MDCTLQDGGFHLYNTTDIEVPGVMGLTIVRHYHSRSNEAGLFGPRWSFNYGSRIHVGLMGTAVLYDAYSRALNFFGPAQLRPVEFVEAVEGMAWDFENRLPPFWNMDNPLFPLQFYQMVYKEYGPDIEPFFEREKAASLKMGLEEIERTEDGYRRKLPGERVEYFGMDGRFVRLEDAYGNWAAAQYEDGLMARLSNSRGHFLVFTYDVRGLVTKIQADTGRAALYEYDEAGQLVHATLYDGKEFFYAYRQDGTGMLTSVVFPDEETLAVSYGAPLDYVASLKRRDGRVSAYTYEESFPADGSHVLKVNVKETAHLSDSLPEIYSIEYRFRENEIGLVSLERKTERRTWGVTDIAYVPGSDTLPLVKTVDGASTVYDYDSLWRLAKEESPDALIEYRYWEDSGNKTYEAHYKKGEENGMERREWYAFEYNVAGNVIRAESSSGRVVDLEYDAMGRLKSVFSNRKDGPLFFDYNEADKPSRIDYKGFGRITIQYDEFWRISDLNVDSGEGVNAAISLFTELIELLNRAYNA